MSRCLMSIMKGEVLIFKALHASSLYDTEDPYLKKLEDVGLLPKVVPVLDFEYCNLKILQEHLENPTKFSGIIFTSPRAVRAAALSLGTTCTLPEEWQGRAAFVVGEGTQQAAAEELHLRTEGSESGSASALADFILQRTFEHPLLFLCGSLKRETLPEKLAVGGVNLVTLTVYRTKSHPQLERALAEATSQGSRVPEFLVYFSPSGVRFSLPVLRKLRIPLEQLKIVAVGPATAATIGESQLSVWSQAAKVSPEFLADAILENRKD